MAIGVVDNYYLRFILFTVYLSFLFFFGWFGSYLSFILYVYQVEQLVTPLMYLVLTELMDGFNFMYSVQEVISLDVPFDMTGCWLRHSLCFFQS